MRTQAEVFLCIRPKDVRTGDDAMDRSLRALDEALTQQITGGAGEHDHVRRCAQVWLLDRREEPRARALIERHGWDVVDEEEILG